MAEADTAAPARSNLAAGDISARLQQVLALLFPSNLAAKAALFAVVVALLPLLPSSQAPRIWELPHLLLLGIVVSYGVFGQKNADAEVAVVNARPDEPSVEAYVSEMMQGSFSFERNGRDGDNSGEDCGAKDGVQAWSSQYLPDDPLVVVADNVMSNDGKGDAGEMLLHLPLRKLKATYEVPATPTGDISEGIDEEEEDEVREFLAPKTGYDDPVRERAIPSPSSVLDADLTLSPSSPPLLPPPPPPFHGIGCSRLQKAEARSFNELGVGDRSMSGRRRLGLLPSTENKQQFRSKSAVHATRSAFDGYDPAASTSYEAADDDGELDAGAASDSSFSSDDTLTDNDKEENSYGEEVDGGDSFDEELIELATRPGPEADEVDRKTEEFIAKFRDQIRMQRVIEPATRR